MAHRRASPGAPRLADHPVAPASRGVPARVQTASDDRRHRSRHHRAFLDPGTGALLLAEGARRLRRSLADAGVPEAAVGEYLSVLGDPAALEAALAWYRAAGSLGRADVGATAVPTLYLWGDRDATVGRGAAAGTGEFVTAPFRLEVLPGVGHFVTDQAAVAVTRYLLDHLAANPAAAR